MSELPNGWDQSSLGDIAEFVMGQAPNSSECNVDGLGTVFVKAGEFGRKTPVMREWTTKPLKFAKEGDVLVCVVGATAGKINLAIDCAIGRSVAAVRPEEFISTELLYYFLKSKVAFLRSGSTGSAQGVISKEDLGSLGIPLPPKEEQKRIAQKLDALLAQVDTLKAGIDAIPALLKRFRESALSAAVSGRLTKSHDKTRHLAEPFRLNDGAQPASAEEISQAIEVTGEPFPDQWTIYALEQIVDGERGISYGIVQTGDPVAEGVSTVRCGDVRHLRIDTSALKVVARDIEKNYARTRLKGGEVLLAIRGSIGNTAVAPKSLANCNISREVAMIPCIEDVDSMFVALVLQSKRGQQLLAGKTRGVAQKGINLADVRRLPIALPSRTAQREIVDRVEQLFTYADQLEAKVAAAQQRIDALTQSLLAKAFRGELVPQDPTDEPASVLLERIRAQRAAAPKPKPKRGRKAATS
ncbi:restriction endonuclease subunit S [Xanthomonas vasicola pv. arecae]|uniref:restriction endonuclease subunit S n=1 Tax=Xanthomonas vasicola TaxID=56459 RepID=UPI00068DAA59|nr:restriction endonuclease subunit S [Xanthomonas vasicola]AZR25877.1 restriction endonuclease subunit S [Xanthomonas vasicola pv. arecae]